MKKIPVLNRYLYKQFLLWWVFLLAGLSALLLLFDIMAQATDILVYHKTVLGPLAAYAKLRLPQIINLLIPLTVLLALLVMFTRLLNSHQIVAIRNFGTSLYQVFLIFLPLVLLITIGHIIFASIILPDTSSALRAWQAEEYREAPQKDFSSTASRWFVDDNTFIHAGRADENGKALYDLTLVSRDEEGQITAIRTALRAAYIQDERWGLSGIRTLYSIANGEEEQQAGMAPAEQKPAITVTPAQIMRLYKTQEETSLGSLLASLHEEKERASERVAKREDEKAKSAAPRTSRLWLHSKFSHPAGSIIMLLLAIPIVLQSGRRPKILSAAFGIIGAGFIFFITERISFSFGESALLPPLFAAWAPFFIFALIGGWILLLAEEYD